MSLDHRATTPALSSWGALSAITLRNYTTYRRYWKLFLTGFLEPVFYLFSIGIGVGQLIDTFEFNGQSIPYAEFVAPGMLAASAFNRVHYNNNRRAHTDRSPLITP